MPSHDRRGRPALTAGERESRRLHILAAAKAVFGGAGFTATKMGDVASAAGLAYGSVYSFFESKEVLFRSVLEQVEGSLRDHVLGRAFPANEPVDLASVLRRATIAVFEYFEADPAAAKVLFRDSHALGERLERELFDIYERFIDDIETLIVEAQRQHLVVDGPPRVIAFSVAALLGQLAFRRLRVDDGLDAEALGAFVAGLLLDGVRPPSARSAQTTSAAGAANWEL